MVDLAEREVSLADLRACVIAILERAEVPVDDAGLIADLLVDAELRGHADHGTILLALYVSY